MVLGREATASEVVENKHLGTDRWKCEGAARLAVYLHQYHFMQDAYVYRNFNSKCFIHNYGDDSTNAVGTNENAPLFRNRRSSINFSYCL